MFSRYCAYVRTSAHAHVDPFPRYCATPIGANAQSPEAKQHQGVGGVTCLTGGCSLSLSLSFDLIYAPKSRAVPSKHKQRQMHIQTAACGPKFKVKFFLFGEKANKTKNDAKKKNKNSAFFQSKNPSRPLSHIIYDRDKQKQLRSPRSPSAHH